MLLGIFSVSVLLRTQEILEATAQADLARDSGPLLAAMAGELQLSPEGFRPAFLPELDLLRKEAGVEVRVLARDGGLLYGSPDFPQNTGRYHLRTERLGKDPASGTVVHLARSGDPMRARLRELGLFLALLVPLGVVVSVIFSIVAIRRIFAPIEAVRLQAEQISRSNVSLRIPAVGTTKELADLIETFNAMLARLEKSIQDLYHFASDAAHELRTPLATIRAELETAIQGRPSIEDYEEIVSSFQVEVGRMNRVVSDLFMLARMDMRQYALQRERIPLGPLLEDSRETWQTMASLRNIQIDFSGDDAEVLGDPAALRRVFMNLVENAVKYNRDGGRVTLALERRNGRVRVRVTDTGLGISAESLPKLFHRFFRADKARSRESGGAGLGLAICKSFVTSMEGTISVESVLGEGSTFVVEFPEISPEVAPESGPVVSPLPRRTS